MVTEPSVTSNPRLLRLKEKTLLYNYRIKHLPGKKNLAADTLSRYPVGALEPDKDETNVSDDLEALVATVAALTVTSEDDIVTDPPRRYPRPKKTHWC